MPHNDFFANFAPDFNPFKMMKLNRFFIIAAMAALTACVWGAKRAGVLTYLVKPIHPKEEIQIVIKRRLEWIVLFFYTRSLGRQGGKHENRR